MTSRTDSGDGQSSQRASARRTRRGVVVAVGGSGLGVGAVVASLSAAPWWAGVALCAVALALLVMAALILFGRRADPSERLIQIIKTMQRR